MVSLTHWALYRWELDEPRSWSSACCGVQRNNLSLSEIEPWPSSQQPIDVPTELRQCISIMVTFMMFDCLYVKKTGQANKEQKCTCVCVAKCVRAILRH